MAKYYLTNKAVDDLSEFGIIQSKLGLKCKLKSIIPYFWHHVMT